MNKDSETINVEIKTPLYLVRGCNCFGFNIVECKVKNLAINEYGIFLDLKGIQNDKIFEIRCHIDLYSKEFFLTKEEAERKIQELKENKSNGIGI